MRLRISDRLPKPDHFTFLKQNMYEKKFFTENCDRFPEDHGTTVFLFSFKAPCSWALPAVIVRSGWEWGSWAPPNHPSL